MRTTIKIQRCFFFWKTTTAAAFVVSVIVISLILPLSVDGVSSAMAEDDKYAHLPVIISPPIPGSTGALAYTVNSGIDRELYIMNPDGSGKKQLTNNYTIKPDSTGLQPLTQTANTSEDRANWGP